MGSLGKNPPDESAVYYDGSCPMCTALVSTVESSTKRGRFSMRDIHKDSLPEDFIKEEVEREMHVVADGRIYRNAAAILRILEEYPLWRPFVWLGRLPAVKQVLPIGYNFVTTNRHFLFGPASRIFWLKVILCLGFIAGLLLSLKLWVSSRVYPLTPVLPVVPIPYPADWILLFALFALLVSVIFFSRPRPLLWASVALVALLVFFDQQRLQPWAYQYVVMLAALGLYSWKWEDWRGRNATLNLCRFLIASIYIWSGIQKVNAEFIGGVFPWMVAPIAQLFPLSVQPVWYAFGVLVPFIEIGIGVGLLTRRLRTTAVLGAVAMCVFVLWTLGPFGHDWNSIVWPWNITMAAMVALLFTKTSSVSLSEILWIRGRTFHKVILVVFGMLPFFYFFNIWDSYLSWSLYSGTTNQARIYMSDRAKERLPAYLGQFVKTDIQGNSVLPVVDWAFGELNVPPYPEARIFKNVARSICSVASDPREVVLVMRGRLSWFYRDGQQVLNCAQLR